MSARDMANKAKIDAKFDALKKILRQYGSLLVAFSGGVDSSFLLKVAYDLLGEKVIAVTATSSTYPASEYQESLRIAKQIGARHITIQSEELDIEEFAKNPPERCYFCKKELFTKLASIARREGIQYIADGSNADDAYDYRPGMTAAAEFGVVTPLKEAGLTKDDIRQLSKSLGLSTWNKPSLACLSSRFPYGEKITGGKLEIVNEAETFLKSIGFSQVRVRHHETIARIEVPQSEIEKFYDDNLRKKIIQKLKQLGYTYITLDLEGYRSGSMNEVLQKPKKSTR